MSDLALRSRLGVSPLGEHQTGGGMAKFMGMPSTQTRRIADQLKILVDIGWISGVPLIDVKMKPV